MPCNLGKWGLRPLNLIEKDQTTLVKESKLVIFRNGTSSKLLEVFS